MRRIISMVNVCLMIAFVSHSCLDSRKSKIQYVPDMADSPKLKPQLNYIEPPAHSVASTTILYPKTPEEAEKILKNPLPASENVVTSGKKLFDTFCTPCHGPKAQGDGSITDLYPVPPNITAANYAQRADGFYFHRITFGSSIMPGYGHAIEPQERWAIIHYLRTLQKQN